MYPAGGVAFRKVAGAVLSVPLMWFPLTLPEATAQTNYGVLLPPGNLTPGVVQLFPSRGIPA
jgi:hypothetical protein